MKTLIIKIPDEVYNFTIQRGHLPYGVNIAGSIIDGKVVSGRLGDVDKILNEIRKREKEPNYQHEGEDWCAGMCIAENIVEQALIEVNKKGE